MLQKAEEEGTLTLEMQQERARRYRQDGKLEEAVSAFKKALDMTSQSWERNQLSNELVQLYAQLGENDLALELYEMLSRSGSMGMSISHGSSGLKVNFVGDEARETLINAYRSQGKLEQLKTLFERRLEKEVDNPAVLEMLAEIYRNTNAHKQAAEMYQALCKVQPGNVRSYYYAAAALNKGEELDLAKELLDQGEVALSASNRKQDMWFLAAVGSICLDGEMYAPAIKLVEDAIAASGRYGRGSWGREQLYDILGKSYLGAERYEEAVNAYQQMANVAQDDGRRKTAEAAMRRAYKDGNLYEALIAERTRAVADNPDDPDTHFALAQTYEWNDMSDEAIAAYERAHELNPDSTVILEPLAKLYASADLEKAKPLYKRLIELEESVLNRIQRRRALIDLYTRSGEYDAAIDEMLNAARSSENEVERSVLLPSLWNLYRSQGRTTEGIATLELLASQLADSPTLHEVLGDAYTETGFPDKAEAAYTKWVHLRQELLEDFGDWRSRSRGFVELVSRLLTKRVLSEKAVELAEHALQLNPISDRKTTLGQAYLINKQPGRVKELIQSESNSEVRHALVVLLANHYQRLGKIDTDVDSLLRKDALHAASTPMEQNAALRELWELYEAATRPSQVTVVGEPAPPVKFNNLIGEVFALSDLNGKVVLLNFWATWCPPCVRGIPQFLALQEQHEPDGLVVVGVSVDREGVDVIKSFVETHGVTYPNLIAGQDVKSLFGGLGSLPTTFLINRDGIIVKHYVGYTDQSVFQEDIKSALAGSR
jgi:cytochrome c biogenesis protein CcmG/thiol:disulfide interchange protein DsbE